MDSMYSKDYSKYTKSQLVARIKYLEAETDAYNEITESLPVDAHDMEVHFWCDPKRCWALQEEEDE
jgi:hypothetical protein